MPRHPRRLQPALLIRDPVPTHRQLKSVPLKGKEGEGDEPVVDCLEVLDSRVVVVLACEEGAGEIGWVDVGERASERWEGQREQQEEREKRGEGDSLRGGVPATKAATDEER